MKDATFVDENGQPQPFYMGCYGIGIGRTLQTIVEIHHDERGIIWPEIVAPFQVHLIDLKRPEEGLALYQKLLELGVEVLYDDRHSGSPGAKFADADLIGCPIRLVIFQTERRPGGVEAPERDRE